MTDHIFAGPSLSGIDRSALSTIHWHPPAQGGDLVRLNLSTGDRVCLIDGAFEAAPAVRHKEILLLLAEGISVFGASSMGALRAAELQTCGMIGAGRIFAAYSKGFFTRDDWVALRHAPVEMDCQPLTVALADLIFGLQDAVRAKILNARHARALLRAGADLFYQDRDWSAIEQASTIESSILENFRLWRAEHWFSQKTEDALSCLALMNRSANETVPEVGFVDTPFLHQFASASGITPLSSRSGCIGQDLLQQS